MAADLAERTGRTVTIPPDFNELPAGTSTSILAKPRAPHSPISRRGFDSPPNAGPPALTEAHGNSVRPGSELQETRAVMYSSHPSLPYAAFSQACRAFRPSELLPGLARTSAALGEPPYSDVVKQQMPPWGLAAAARESLLYGNEHRSAPVTDKALRALMRKFAIAMDIKDGDIGTDAFLINLITRMTYEQFPYQESMFEEVARSHALLVEGLPDVQTQIITESALANMLDGMSLREAIGATLLSAGLRVPERRPVQAELARPAQLR